MWIEQGALMEPASIEISEWEEEAGEEVVKSQGGELKEGSSYESKYFVVRPFDVLANGNKVTMQMKVTSSDVTIYHSTDYKTWTEVSNVEVDDDVAKFQYHKGKLI